MSVSDYSKFLPIFMKNILTTPACTRRRWSSGRSGRPTCWRRRRWSSASARRDTRGSRAKPAAMDTRGTVRHDFEIISSSYEKKSFQSKYSEIMRNDLTFFMVQILTRRVRNVLFGGECRKCDCNGHSASCNPFTFECGVRAFLILAEHFTTLHHFITSQQTH